MTGRSTNSSIFDQFALGPEQKRAYRRVHEPSHPQSVRLLAFQSNKEGGLEIGRDVPSRAISGLLGNLIIYEPLADGADFRVHHAGTAYIAHYGGDVTGKLMSEIFEPAIFQYNRTVANGVIRRGVSEIFEANLSQFGITRRRYEIALLPVWARGRTGRWLLCAIFQFD
jgi:hypothetical protein